MAVGSGLICTLNTQSNAAHWISYEVLTGIGSGIGFQIPYTAVSVVLPEGEGDVPIANALIVFSKR